MKTNSKTNKTIFSRASGILAHPTSFPGPYGIGDLGDGAYHFIDFLEQAGQKLWQVLPLSPTGFGDSPYQSFSSFAGQPLIISPDKLVEMELLIERDLHPIPAFNPHVIDYGAAISYKNTILKKAYRNFTTDSTRELQDEFNSFCKEEASWLDDYALYMAGKDYHKKVCWLEWDTNLRDPDEKIKKKWHLKLKKEVDYYRFIQFLFFQQWFELKEYANEKGIKIIGDIPIFVSVDSSDLWANRDLFYLDEDGFPTVVAGVPPDYFSATGQLWGNPLYDWRAHKKEKYTWWINRIKAQLDLYDYLRIDHFRGFDSYWEIPAGEETAIKGVWKKGPGADFFKHLEAALGDELPIIAEDLGIITEDVERLRDRFSLPGMKVLQFAFDNPNENNLLPHAHPMNSVCYTGTHDNDTSLGWYQTASWDSQDKVRRYMNTDGNDISWDFIRTCLGSVAHTAIIPLQDIFSLGSDDRMNRPGTAMGNWSFRYRADYISDYIIKRLLELTILYGR